MGKPLTLLLLFASCPASATTYLGEDWEAGTPPAGWPYTVCPSQPLTYNGWSNDVWQYCANADGGPIPDWSCTGRVLGAAKDGSYGFRHCNHNPQRTSGDIVKSFPPTPVRAPVYVSFHARFVGVCSGPEATQGWCNFNNPVSREPSNHFYFMNTGAGGTGPRMNILTRVPYVGRPQCEDTTTGGGPFASFSFQMDSQDVAAGTWTHPTEPNGCWNILAHLGEWHWYVFLWHPEHGNGALGHGAIWVDGDPSYRGDFNWQQNDAREGFDTIVLSNFVSDADGMTSNLEYHLDNLQITDTFPTEPGSPWLDAGVVDAASPPRDGGGDSGLSADAALDAAEAFDAGADASAMDALSAEDAAGASSDASRAEDVASAATDTVTSPGDDSGPDADVSRAVDAGTVDGAQAAQAVRGSCACGATEGASGAPVSFFVALALFVRRARSSRARGECDVKCITRAGAPS